MTLGTLESVNLGHLKPLQLSLEDFEALYVENPRFAGRRFELIRGEVFEMTPMGDNHYGAITLLGRELTLKLLPVAMVSVQTPVRAPLVGSRPEPDFTVMHLADFTGKVPLLASACAVIEVSDSTLKHDRKVKLEDYAREGVTEYWIVNLNDLTLEVYRQPQGDTYGEKHTYQPGQLVSLMAFPDILIDWAIFIH
jgi:Uma2 family endonuclease